MELEDEDGDMVRIKVPEQVQYHFRQLVYYADYQRRRDRSCKLKECTPELFDELESHRHIKASYKPSKITLAALTDDTTKVQTDAFKQWDLEFTNHRGQDGICMGYMFRKDLVPPDEEDDDETKYRCLLLASESKTPLFLHVGIQ